MTIKFQPADRKLPQLDARALGDLVFAAADLTVVVDSADVVEHLSHNLRDLSDARISAWQGRPVDEIVRRGSRPALKTMLRSARDGKPAGGFDIGHLLEGGQDLPIRYSAFGIGEDGQVILVGRDLRPVAELQSQLLANRQSLLENRKRQRQVEAQYRALFETSAEAILIVDAGTGRIREANPCAAALLDFSSSDLGGKRLISVFGRPRQAEIQAMLASVTASGAPATLTVEATGNGRPLVLAADLFRADELKLIRLRVSTPDDRDGRPAPDTGLDDLVRNAAEGILLTDEDGRVVWANESFLTLAGIPLAAQATGRPLDDFLHWPGIEREALLARLRRQKRIAALAGTVEGVDGRGTPVEMSGVVRSDGAQPGYAFVMRARAPDDSAPNAGENDLARTAEALAERIGRVPMKDLVRDTTDVIERMCIEAALRLTGNNRASAARTLGLSRQALYLKMNRFGIADEE